MLTTPLKIGIAVACLVGIAAIIAVDQVRLQRRESMTITTSVAPAAQTALPPVVAPAAAPAAPVVAAPAAETVICPSPAAEAPAKPAAPAPVKESSPTMYTVAQGDSLYGISTKVYGTPRHYERIYEANRDRIKDPNTLQVGINLKMPEITSR